MKITCKFCGKKFLNSDFLAKHKSENHPERPLPENNYQKGWNTPYGFCDFQNPVSYEYACEFMKKVSEGKSA